MSNLMTRRMWRNAPDGQVCPDCLLLEGHSRSLVTLCEIWYTEDNTHRLFCRLCEHFWTPDYTIEISEHWHRFPYDDEGGLPGICGGHEADVCRKVHAESEDVLSPVPVSFLSRGEFRTRIGSPAAASR